MGKLARSLGPVQGRRKGQGSTARQPGRPEQCALEDSEGAGSWMPDESSGSSGAPGERRTARCLFGPAPLL